MNSDSGTPPQPRSTGLLAGRRVVVAVTGGIAAYKTCFLVRELVRAGAEVQVLMSKAGTEFVSPLTFSTLSGRPVVWEMFPATPPIDPVHLTPAHWGDLFVVAPATADFVGKLAHGLADDIPSTVAMAFRGPMLIAPAMNPNMWASPAVMANMEMLRKRGIEVIGPEYGEMGGLREQKGSGRMSEPEEILDRIDLLLADRSQLKGTKILVTSGPTREKIDPVRYISNFSSGRMGDAIAREALLRGAEVTLVRGKGAVDKPPQGVELHEVDSAGEMASAVKELFPSADLLVMAAAVADWTPSMPSSTKLKKDSGDLSIEWKQTEDILAWAGRNKSQRFVIGFALETMDHISGGKKKLVSKNADMIVLNDPTRADSLFGGDSTKLTLLLSNGETFDLDVLSKRQAAGKILDAYKQFVNNV